MKKMNLSEAYCPIILGVSFLDQIKTLENLKKLNLKNCIPITFFTIFK